MQFHIGQAVYRLVVANSTITDTEGNEIEGCALESRRLLIISRIVEPDRREEVALHEFAHAWGFHVPRPSNEEERCQLTATIAQQFAADLERGGGRKALMTMPPQHVAIRNATKKLIAPAIPDAEFGRPAHMECSGCSAIVVCGSIDNGPPELHEYTGKWRVERWMHCDACGTLTVWWESVHEDGNPTGEIWPHPKPKMIRGAEASRFLADKRELAGT